MKLHYIFYLFNKDYKMNIIADILLYFSDFTQLKLYIQNIYNKKANIQTNKEKLIKENKNYIKKLSENTLNNNKTKNYEYVNIEYNDGSTIVGEKMW